MTEEKECPRCGKATVAGAAVCDKCGYVYQAEGGSGSRAERYQALLAQEAQAAPPQADVLRRTLPPAVGWGIIAACLLVVLGAGWAMFGSTVTDSSAAGPTMDQPIITSHHRRPQPLAGPQNVTYSVTGTAASALITDSDAAGAKPISETLPWTQTVKAKPGAHLFLSATPSGGAGAVAVSLSVNGTRRQQSAAPAVDGQTTVEDTL